MGNCWSGALAILGQARAKAVAGSTSAARNSYQRFFDLWKTAEADLPILKSARLEYAKLKWTSRIPVAIPVPAAADTGACFPLMKE